MAKLVTIKLKYRSRPRWRGRLPRAVVHAPRLLLCGEFARRSPRHLTEGVRKRRHAGIAEIGGELLDGAVTPARQPLDRRRDPRALAPGLEAEPGLRGKPSRQ